MNILLKINQLNLFIMKRIFLLLATIGLFAVQSCTVNDGIPGRDGLDGQDGQGSIISEVFELKNINFGFSVEDGYTIYQKLTPNIFASDVILIYRLSGTVNATTPIWQPIPRTLFLTQGELDYDFDFSKEDFTIYAGGTYNLNLTPTYINNQTFRIVIVPGAFSNKSAVSETLSYEETIAKYKIDDSKVTILN